MKSKPLPSQETLRHLFNYDPDTGVFTWKNPNPKAKSLKPGKEVGGYDGKGYRVVRINGEKFLIHRLVWMWHYGVDPGVQDVDHINGTPDDNRINNLRLVNHQHNHFNRTTAKGYCWHKVAKKWLAQIMVSGECVYLGLHKTEEEARQAYLNAKENLHIIETHGTQALQNT